MKAIDHSIGAALQACASQAPAKEPQYPAAPVARSPERGREKVIRRDSEPVREREGTAELHLTPRQLEVLALVCEGFSNKQICRRLDIAPGTVKVHISCLLREFGVRSRLELVVEALRLGLFKGPAVEARRQCPVQHAVIGTRSRGLLDRLLVSGSGPEATPAKQAAVAAIAAGSAGHGLMIVS